MLRLFGAEARIRNVTFPQNHKNPLIFKGQYEFLGVGGKPFATFGDSGSLVFAIDPTEELAKQLQCVGMVCGGTDDYVVFVTPIAEVLKALGLKDDCFKVFRMETEMEH